MSLSTVIMQLVSLFLMMAAGYLVARVGIMTPEFRAKLSSYTLSLAAPCAILSGVLESSSTPATMIGTRMSGLFSAKINQTAKKTE